MVSHLAGANKERLKRANKNARHSVFGKILCFRKLCRIQSGHPASLKAIRFKKFKKRIERNARKGAYKRTPSDSTYRQYREVREAIPTVIDTVTATVNPVVKADSLIVLGAELLFETNKSTLQSDHFEMLNSIVDYLVLHQKRLVKISGHTDNTGNNGHNLTLSKRRADVVAEYLVTNGVDINRIETFGYGSTKPLEENSTEEGRKKNRRVELLIYDEP